MSHSLKLFVIDTGPLITLAVANALDYLLYVQADIVIPDAVLYEATHDAAKLGAQDIIDWVKVNRTRIELAPTQAFAIFEAAREMRPKLRQPDLGERAAVEVIEEPDRLTGNERAVLLCEETALFRRGETSAERTMGSPQRPLRRCERMETFERWRGGRVLIAAMARAKVLSAIAGDVRTSINVNAVADCR
jgi:hypothetical protein